jgi:vacuolar-type H+-ATPase subunit I/STV1
LKKPHTISNHAPAPPENSKYIEELDYSQSIDNSNMHDENDEESFRETAEEFNINMLDSEHNPPDEASPDSETLENLKTQLNTLQAELKSKDSRLSEIESKLQDNVSSPGSNKEYIHPKDKHTLFLK